MGNKKRRHPPKVFQTSQMGPFQVIRMRKGHHFTVPVWRAYMTAIQSNDADAGLSARILTRVPVLENASGDVTTMESWAVANKYSLLETADALCSLEDDGLIVWDVEKQIGRHP